MKLRSVVFSALACASAFGLSQAQDRPSEMSEPPAEAIEQPGAPSLDEAPPEPTIPTAFPASRYDSAWGKNPFMRKTVAIAAPKETWVKDYALNGMAQFNGKIYVSIVNKQTGKYERLTNEEGSNKEFHLKKANFSHNRSEASAEIEKGGEVATITYDDSMTSKPITINNTQGAPGGAPGKPGQPGVAPGRPGQPTTAAAGVGGRVGGVQAAVTPGAGSNAMARAGAIQPTANTPVQANVPQPPTPPTAPSISRRRQLVPPPVIPTSPAP